MKKYLLTLALTLAMAGATLAQDVWSVGYFNEEGNQKAAIYKNDQMYHYAYYPGITNVATSVVQDPTNGDVYWSNCSSQSGTPYKAAIYCNRQQAVSIDDAYIHNMFWYDDGSNYQPMPSRLYSAGYRMGTDNRKYATVWIGTSSIPLFSPDYMSGYESEAYGICVTLEEIDHSGEAYARYYCGYAQHSEGGGSPVPTVWKNDEVLYELGDHYGYAYGLDYYSGDVYTVGCEIINDNYVAKVWKNNSELYALTSDLFNARAWKIKVVDGDVYVCGWAWGGTTLCIWKNGELMHIENSGSPTNLRSFAVNENGVYYAVVKGPSSNNYTGYIYKDGVQLYAPESCDYLYDLCVEKVECGTSNAQSTPYFEGFERCFTDWACWEKIDVDDDNYSYWSGNIGYEVPSYWMRFGNSNDDPYQGDYCARHRFGEDYQHGVLITPQIHLQCGAEESYLTFQTREQYPEDLYIETVLISTTGNNAGDFNPIWNQENPSNEWKEVKIDLSAYECEDIYIAFEYGGENGHTWFIDNVLVDQSLVGVSEEYKDAFTVSPNPANASIQINGLDADSEVYIYNMLGERVMTVRVGDKQEIDISELSDGLYFLRCGNKTARFVKAL